jgi:hypothetical protein
MVLQAGCTQVRVAGFGGTIGFDYNALKILADCMGVETPPAFWMKVRAVENVIRKLEAKEEKIRERHRSKGRK